jgi:hypothetical protein
MWTFNWPNIFSSDPPPQQAPPDYSGISMDEFMGAYGTVDPSAGDRKADLFRTILIVAFIIWLYLAFKKS